MSSVVSLQRQFLSRGRFLMSRKSRRNISKNARAERISALRLPCSTLGLSSLALGSMAFVSGVHAQDASATKDASTSAKKPKTAPTAQQAKSLRSKVNPAGLERHAAGQWRRPRGAERPGCGRRRGRPEPDDGRPGGSERQPAAGDRRHRHPRIFAEGPGDQEESPSASSTRCRRRISANSRTATSARRSRGCRASR